MNKTISPLTSHSHRYTPSQADVAVYKAMTQAPDPERHPHSARWYKHIASYADTYETLPGDSNLAASAYGPETTAVPENPAQAPAVEDEEDVDLFGSDDEEEDAAKAELTKKRLEEYAAKKVDSLNFHIMFRN